MGMWISLYLNLTNIDLVKKKPSTYGQETGLFLMSVISEGVEKINIGW